MTSSLVEPLTRNGYVRLAKVERQICEAATLAAPALVDRRSKERKLLLIS